jgi:gamma-glutamyl-gamma-aminobutyrate hydrolase PuuD
VKPRIGITSETDVAVAEYERAVHGAGGEPVRLLPDAGPALIDTLDGIIFSGGEDVDPQRYGQAPHPDTEPASPQRDGFELALVRAAFERGLPTLAICRGIQVANVAFGGSLHQHVPDAYGTLVPHQPQVDGKTFRGLIDEHHVTIEASSQLARLVGTDLVTGSRHHQALDRIAPAFTVVARAGDGVVEALEAPQTSHFWLGVQWHPESTVDLDGGASAALFRALVAASAAVRSGR